MLYIDTCVLLAVLTPEVHSSAATSFLAQAQAGAILQVFERSLAPGLLLLELEPQDFRNANQALEVPPSAAWMLRLLQRQNSWA